MSILGIRAGSWWFRSESNPRWDMSGRTRFLSIMAWPDEAQTAFDAKKAQLGDPPDDLKYGCMKD